jgi:hypothetical protein
MTEPTRRPAAAHVNEDGSAKVHYVSRKVARAAGRRLVEKVGWKLSEYRCAECDGWHLSKSIPRRAEA